MTLTEAQQIRREFYRKRNPTESDEFLYTEAMMFIIETAKEPEAMMELGGLYYDMKKFDLALKYYEMAADCGYPDAGSCLGYIWYYGRTGEKNYEKAYKYFKMSADMGNLESAYKVADMYKNGYYVEKDIEKYKSIIEELYEKVKGADNLYAPLPQIFMRTAEIRRKDGKLREAAEMYLYAKGFLAQRLRLNPFFGDMTNMKWLISSLYETVDFDSTMFDFYDLYYVLKRPAKVSFMYGPKKFTVESMEEDGAIVVKFGDKWFRNPDDFMAKSEIAGKRLTSIYSALYMFELY